MRVLHVIETLGRGGAEQALVNVLPALRECGVTSEVAVLWPPYDLATELEEAGIAVHRLGIPHRWGVPRAVAALGAVRDRGSYDVVHAHLYFAELYTALTARGRSFSRHVVTFHNFAYHSWSTYPLWLQTRKKIESLALRRRFGAYVAVSAAVAGHVQEHLGVRDVQVIPNSFPVERLRPAANFDRRGVRLRLGIDPAAFLIVTSGRLAAEKGHVVLLEAVALLRDRRVRPSVLLVGDGPMRDELRARIAASGLHDQVTMHPAVPHAELLHIVQAGDAFVLPSISEGFGLAPAEAMALEVPVIASRTGGLVDLVEDARSGMLVEPGAAEPLADAIARLMTDGALALRLGQAGRERVVERFSTRVVADQLSRLYQRMAAAAHG